MPTRFFLVRISIRDLVADRKSLVRNSGVGGGGQNLILKESSIMCENAFQHPWDGLGWLKIAYDGLANLRSSSHCAKKGRKMAFYLGL